MTVSVFDHFPRFIINGMLAPEFIKKSEAVVLAKASI
jgi:hypothetical protein